MNSVSIPCCSSSSKSGVDLRLLLEAGDFILGELGRHEEVERRLSRRETHWQLQP